MQQNLLRRKRKRSEKNSDLDRLRFTGFTASEFLWEKIDKRKVDKEKQ